MRKFACVVAALGALATVGSAFAGPTLTQKTASYTVTLSLGSKEPMYTPAEAKAKHLKSGEVMVGGSMAMDMSSGMGGAVRHLEVHITSNATGKSVTTVMPKIAITDKTAKGMADLLTVVKMKGVGEPASDIHFGNNVDIHVGHSYTVAVGVGGEKATFQFTAS
ncbi:MAG: hypothetical protein F2663_01090 [Actinobacteria bacterium]|uniref:Unannotated protein n=1 Tax=freshwater metagenome TaxID=449393 RepID=A0A6J6NFT7_9ZZZZ|nr:hypothetical protein [Actinomycetota bacterium]